MENRLTASGEDEGVEGLTKKEKWLMDMDNSVVIVWEGVIRGLSDNGKKFNKKFIKK